MAKLAIVAPLEVAPGGVDKLRPILAARRARCLRDEPGTPASAATFRTRALSGLYEPRLRHGERSEAIQTWRDRRVIRENR
jgi:hypothetical protein